MFEEQKVLGTKSDSRELVLHSNLLKRFGLTKTLVLSSLIKIDSEFIDEEDYDFKTFNLSKYEIELVNSGYFPCEIENIADTSMLTIKMTIKIIKDLSKDKVLKFKMCKFNSRLFCLLDRKYLNDIIIGI